MTRTTSPHDGNEGKQASSHETDKMRAAAHPLLAEIKREAEASPLPEMSKRDETARRE